MVSTSIPLACEIELRPGERLRLPDTLTERVGAGRWLVTVQPADAVEPTRLHGAFLSAYVPEDEGLYDDAATR